MHLFYFSFSIAYLNTFRLSFLGLDIWSVENTLLETEFSIFNQGEFDCEIIVNRIGLVALVCVNLFRVIGAFKVP